MSNSLNTLVLITITITSFLLVSSTSFFVNAQTPVDSLKLPTIEITSHHDGDKVKTGELTIEGISSDNDTSDCQVSADINDIKPMQSVTAEGDEGSDDFSDWSFTYTEDYQLIKSGENELTAKISCSYDVIAGPLSDWHSVNVTGIGADISGLMEPTDSSATEEATVSLPFVNTGNDNTVADTSVDESSDNDESNEIEDNEEEDEEDE